MKLMVIDTETTSLDAWNGHIVEIAICELDLENMTYKLVFDSLVGYEHVSEHAWIFEHSDLTPQMIKEAFPEKNVFQVANQVRKITKGCLVTSYRTAFDWAFVTKSPWRLGEVSELAECIMEAATPVCDIQHDYYGTKWPKLTEAFRKLVKKPISSTHRAAIDCEMAAQVLLKLIEGGHYKIETGGN